MEAVPLKDIAINSVLEEALSTHKNLSEEDISFALASLNPNLAIEPNEYTDVTRLDIETIARFLLLIHRKLYTGMRARVFNHILDTAVRERDMRLVNDLLNVIPDGFWELTNPDLTPEEREELIATEQLELSSVLSVMDDPEGVSKICSGELCKDAICVSTSEPEEITSVPETIFISRRLGRFSATNCFSYLGLIDAMMKNVNPYTGRSFSPDLLSRYSLDIKLAKWSEEMISSGEVWELLNL